MMINQGDYLGSLFKYDQLFNFDNHHEITFMVKALCDNNPTM
jgi:hypothetical protein